MLRCVLWDAENYVEKTVPLHPEHPLGAVLDVVFYGMLCRTMLRRLAPIVFYGMLCRTMLRRLPLHPEHPLGAVRAPLCFMGCCVELC